MLLRRRGFLHLDIGAPALSLVLRPPPVAFPRRPIHAPFHEAEKWGLGVAGTVTLPDMSAMGRNLVVEGVVDGHVVGAVVVDGGGETLKAWAVTRAVVAAGVAPGCGEEEVGVDGFVEQGVDCVGSGTVL